MVEPMPSLHVVALQFIWYAVVLFVADYATKRLLGPAVWTGLSGHAWIVIGALLLVAGTHFRACVAAFLAWRCRKE